MAYFEPYIDADGIHVPSYGDILEYITDQYKTIFGEEVYLGEETPDYQIVSIFSKCLSDYSALAVDAYNARDPRYASGDALDSAVEQHGIVRKRSTASTATLKLGGEEGTVIPAGSQAIDSSGNLWTIQDDVELPSSGSDEVESICETLGAVVAPVGAINGIYTPVPGWYSVTNEEVGKTGNDTETDAELRERFFATYSDKNNGVFDSILSGLKEVEDVTFVGLVQNDTDTDHTGTGGLPPHSFCAIVDGGETQGIAEKVFALKPPGVATYGNQPAVTVIDSYGNSNSILFSRPTNTAVSITVTIKALPGYDADRVNSIIKSALESDVNSLGIGKSWSVTTGYRDVYAAFVNVDIPFTVTNISAQVSGGSATTDTISCAYDEKLYTDDTHITITVVA